LLEREIIDNGGWMGFDRFMQRALNEPGLGYYAAPSTKLGAAGDFTTAPELGDLLAECLAQFFRPILERMSDPAILELGAGTGRLALDLLQALAAAGLEQLRYEILETSSDLGQRQRETLAPVAGRVNWLDRLPLQGCERIVLCNEVADALPVVRFEKRDGQIFPLGVAHAEGRFHWQIGAFDSALAGAVAAIERARGAAFSNGYRSEICLLLAPWVASLAQGIGDGGLLVVDYGLPARDYYRSDRNDGTLLCYFRQRALSDPFRWPGLQDISAWIDFSRLAAAGRAAGLELAGFTTQGQFLLETMAALPGTILESMTPRTISAAKTMILPGEMGERFKLMWLTRGGTHGGLSGRDFRSWL
jgi:SAM-dependent MidA family methyltransferase